MLPPKVVHTTPSVFVLLRVFVWYRYDDFPVVYVVYWSEDGRSDARVLCSCHGKNYGFAVGRQGEYCAVLASMVERRGWWGGGGRLCFSRVLHKGSWDMKKRPK